MKKIFVASPYQGNHCQVGTEEHLNIARRLCKAIVSDIVLPVCPHIYFPQFLDDNDPIQREIGCLLSLSLLRECLGMIVYDGCCGISEGMKAEIEEAETLGIKIAYLCSLHELEIKGALSYLVNFGREIK